MKYYFAYGSNMNHEQMKERCPNARFIKRAFLKDFKFVYDGYSSLRHGAVANVVQSQGHIVFGGLYEVDDECIQKLDKYEGYPTFYQREIVEVHDDSGNTYEAIIYLREPQVEGKPAERYRETVIKGARDCGLPEDYINEFIAVHD